MRKFVATIAACAALAAAIGGYAPAPASAAWDASLTATLVDDVSRAPVAGVQVKLYDLHGGLVLAKTTSGANGEFTLTGLRGGEYRIDFVKTGYHDTTLVGVYVKPHTADHMRGMIAMYPSSEKVPRFAATNPCGKLVNPNQIADVYVICGQ